MAKTTSTGTIFRIAADVPTAFTDDATDGFPSLTYTEVGEVIDLPEYGPNVQVVESNPLATGITEKFKGFINYGSQAIGLERDSEDAGQQILLEAVEGATMFDRHSVEIEYQDGSIEYYAGKVFSYTTNPGSANSMVGSTAQMEIETPIIRVAAPA